MSLSIELITVSIVVLQIQLKHNQISQTNKWFESYDYVVIGGGTAGAVVAHRLTENPTINVLLLEAGGPQTVTTDIPANWMSLLNSQVDWSYRTVRQPGYGLNTDEQVTLSAGRVIGGSSTINAMNYNRGNRRDYDQWADQYGAIGWTFDDILPHFIKSENNSDMSVTRAHPGFHGVEGKIRVSSDQNPQQILKLNIHAFNELGFETIDINGPKQLGTTIAQSFINIDTGMRSGTGNAFIDPNPHPYNLHILTNAFVVKILFNHTSDHNFKAIGVQFVQNNKTYQVMAKHEVILSAGSIKTPQLLMLSGIGPQDHLIQLNISVKVNLPVGNYLQDHSMVGPINALIKNTVPFNETPVLTINQLHMLLINGTGPLSRSSIVYTYFNTKSNQDKDWPNMLISTSVANVNSSQLSYLLSQNNKRKNLMSGYLNDHWQQMFVYLYKVKSYGTVRLASNKPNDYPLIDPKYLSNPQDYQDMFETLKFIYYYLTQSSISRYVQLLPEPIPPCNGLCPPNKRYYECDLFIKCLIRQLGSSVGHVVGTCRMGGSGNSDAVVDPELRVNNVKGLRVCDASVMPRIPNANTNAASIMIGEMCSQFIGKQVYI